MLVIEEELGIDRKARFWKHEAKQEKQAKIRKEQQRLTAEGVTVAQQTFDNRFNSAEEWAHFEYMFGDIEPWIPGVDHKQMIDYLFDNGILPEPKTGDEHRDAVRSADEVLIKGQLGSCLLYTSPSPRDRG